MGGACEVVFARFEMRSLVLMLVLAGASALAQNGDRPGEVQEPPKFKAPPAPPLSPEEAIKSFKIQPGYRIEIVAAEPLIEAPVAMAWHPDGSLYVLQMRDFMPDVDGVGETNRLGRVSVLQDTNGDGRMDKATVFLDNLQMPRALALAYGGVIVAEPPNLLFCRDTNGDLVSDERTIIANDYGNQSNPEHTANGLLWAMDNWIYNANHNKRLRRVGVEWQQEDSAVRSGRGQWGIAQDDFGRLVFNSNSDYLRGDLVSADLLQRNTNNPSPFGANVQFDRNQKVFPARVNPGVNRGYQKGVLRDDGTLEEFTAACGPVIYRGDQFDSHLRGAAFVCEPSANLVRASILTEKRGVITATNAFPNSEFLASTDERFRPVNLYNGPDGALYVVDFYRGHLQHRIYQTTYLRKQILERDLGKPVNLGRIYRVVQEGRARRKIEPLGAETTKLVAALQEGNGWTRDTAQRLLVERNDSASVTPLKALAVSNSESYAGVHALRVLEAMEKLDAETVISALASKNGKTRATAAVLAGEIANTNSDARAALAKLANDPEPLARLNSLFSMGHIAGNGDVARAMASILRQHAGEALFRDAALSGLGGQEAAFLDALLKNPHWQESFAGGEKVIGALARAIAISKNESAIMKLLDFAAAEKAWRRDAMLAGFTASVPPAPKGRPAPPVKPIELKAEPVSMAALRKLNLENVKAVEELLTWPGKAGGAEKPAEARELNEAEKKLFAEGKELYAITCGACHMPHGLGQEGLAPPLANSEWVTGSPERLARIALQGLRGPITVLGKQYSMEMAPLGVLEDEQLAQVLTYVRREWGNTASPIDPEFVAKVRAATAERSEPWSEEELLKIP